MDPDLIDTQWNVNVGKLIFYYKFNKDLIDTQWNVNEDYRISLRWTLSI